MWVIRIEKAITYLLIFFRRVGKGISGKPKNAKEGQNKNTLEYVQNKLNNLINVSLFSMALRCIAIASLKSEHLV